jgi:hypothetical protein
VRHAQHVLHKPKTRKPLQSLATQRTIKYISVLIVIDGPFLCFIGAPSSERYRKIILFTIFDHMEYILNLSLSLGLGVTGLERNET